MAMESSTVKTKCGVFGFIILVKRSPMHSLKQTMKHSQTSSWLKVNHFDRPILRRIRHIKTIKEQVDFSKVCVRYWVFGGIQHLFAAFRHNMYYCSQSVEMLATGVDV